MKAFIVKSYGRKGEEIVRKNNLAVDRGVEYEKIDVPQEWANIEDEAETATDSAPEFIKNVVRPINAQRGYDLPVSAFTGR